MLEHGYPLGHHAKQKNPDTKRKIWYHLHAVFKVINLEKQSRMVPPRDYRNWKGKELLLNGYMVSDLPDEKFQRFIPQQCESTYHTQLHT